MRESPTTLLHGTRSDSTSPTLTDCSIHDGAATSRVLAKQLLSDKWSHASDVSYAYARDHEGRSRLARRAGLANLRHRVLASFLHALVSKR
jgi:hypothetical protein